MNRQFNLDYLRGLAAFGIMIFHYLSWSLGNFTADSFMGRLGVYGVSVFYVLSGLTLYFVYFEKMNLSTYDIVSFFKKRVFRIFPLLWLVTFAAIVISRKLPDFTNLFLNLTGLFGFLRWDKYFSAGVWSIGNELVFYVFFPFFVLFVKKYKPAMIVLSLVIFILYVYFAFFRLKSELNLNSQWKNYVNPLNQVFLFLGGFLIGHFFNKKTIKNYITISLLIISSSFFVLYPVTGDTINIVTGTNRLLFTSCCFIICICFYKLTIKFPGFIHKPLTFLGEASYSVYLLHPIIWLCTDIAAVYLIDANIVLPTYVKIYFSISFTLVVSYFVYTYFEKYFMKLGNTWQPMSLQQKDKL